jgi:acyl carrier protein
MTRQEIERRIIEIAAERGGVKPQQITPATHFVNDLNYDSLELVEFTMELEDEFELSVPDDQADKLMTVGAVVDFVTARVDAAAPSA